MNLKFCINCITCSVALGSTPSNSLVTSSLKTTLFAIPETIQQSPVITVQYCFDTEG